MAFAFASASMAQADALSGANPLRPVVGRTSADLVVPGDTLLDVAFRNGVGFEALKSLNPDIDTWLPVPGTVVELPTKAILPRTESPGLVLNIPEMRLFDFRGEDGPRIIAAAVGDAEDPTPTGSFQIRDKRVDPVWYVPKSIRAERPELPAQVPPGEDNPLGSRWMRIGTSSYGIHGTNVRWSIGREATHGCVRLYEEDVRDLFDRTPDGTPLEIAYEPYKWGREGSRILLEAHPDRYSRLPDRLAAALHPMRVAGLLDQVDIEKVWRTVEEARGIPVEVGKTSSIASP